MNRAAELLGVTVPIVQAPIGSATTAELAAAVSNAGGLGTLAGTWRSPDALRKIIHHTQALTTRPFGVNLVLAFDTAELLEIILAAGVRVVSFSWGDPAPWIPVVHRTGGIVVHSVGNAVDAKAAVDAGADLLVAQGREAGGHVQGTTPLAELLAEMKGGVSVPVLAAGGIGDVNAARRALALGADGLWLGTRFLASRESSAHPDYKQAILEAGSADTMLGVVFTIGWADAPHRVIRNSTVRAWESSGRQHGGRPGEGDVVARFEDGKPVVRYEDVIPVEGMTGELESLALYAGESVGSITEILPAATIVEQMSAAFRT